MHALSFNSALRRLLLYVLVLSIMIMVPIVVILGWNFYDYRQLSEHARHTQTVISKLEISLAEVTAETEAWYSTRADKHKKRIHQLWPLIWQLTDALQVHESRTDTRQLKTLLSRQELNHWRIVDLSQKRLHTPLNQLYLQTVSPASARLFAITTQLVNNAKRINDLEQLGIAADLRGYSTRLSSLLMGASYDIKMVDWKVYWATYGTLLDILKDAKQEQSTLGLSLEQLIRELETFHSNAMTMRDIQAQKHHFGADQLIKQSRVLHDDALSELRQLRSQTNTKQANIRQATDERLMLTFLLCALTGIACLLYLNRWRISLVNTIASPLRRIAKNSHQIAKGELTADISEESSITEIQQLVSAMQRVRTIVSQNIKEEQVRHKAHQVFTALNTAFHQAQSTQSFCKLALDIIHAHYPCIAAAIFLRSDKGEHHGLRLVAGVNLAQEHKAKLQKHHSPIAEHVFETGKATQFEAEHSPIKIDTATSSRTIETVHILPLRHGPSTFGVLEMLNSTPQQETVNTSSTDSTDDYHYLTEKLAILIQSRLEMDQTQALLNFTQEQKSQLDQTNNELTLQTQALQQSEAELEMQADELKISNRQLLEQSKEINDKNQHLETLNTELQALSKQLSYANEQKSLFLSKVSHELRTPLNSIMVLTQTLLRDAKALPQNQTDSLNVILQSGQDLLLLINDLLDLAKIEAGRMDFIIDHVDVRAIIEKLEKQFQPLAQKKQLSWNTHIDDNVPKMIQSDAKRLCQVLRNLLSNAFKFTEQGEVSLRVSCDDTIIHFTVNDTGLGIKPESQAILFDAFRQSDESIAHQFEGTGLGLTISKSIANNLCGKLHFTSEFSVGSAFTLTLPLDGKTPVEREPLPTCLVIDHDVEIYDYLSAHNIKQRIQLLRCKNGTMPESSSQLRYVIISLLDANNVSQLNQHDLEPFLLGLDNHCSIIALVEDSMPPSLYWLEATTNTVLRWNTAGQAKLTALLGLDTTANPQPSDNQHAMSLASQVNPPRQSDNASSNENLQPESPTQKIEFTQSYSILLLDNDMRNLFNLSILLKQAGMTTHLTDTFELAKQKLLDTRIDIIVTGLVDVVESEHTLIDYLNEYDKLKQVPVIFFADKLPEAMAKQCVAPMCQLKKPVDSGALLACIKTLLEPEQKHATSPSKQKDALDESEPEKNTHNQGK
ncbi:ATP-binding protein [Aestuariibacter sp. AA17]|uniref:histidine kinase n=1 Tax=Fluctibacter corallii TaxID=2984329 RepID=A0ABT3A8V1_9ALTE|nr:ATP-binding protein [Aestuariibacter sp. AA17]MCV2885017.1 ATP-binding protein [Aestuariibacter sp. AA17]